MKIKWFISKAFLRDISLRRSVHAEDEMTEYLVLKTAFQGAEAFILSFQPTLGYSLELGELYSLQGIVKQAKGGTYLVLEKIMNALGQEVLSPQSEEDI